MYFNEQSFSSLNVSLYIFSIYSIIILKIRKLSYVKTIVFVLIVNNEIHYHSLMASFISENKFILIFFET